MLTEVREWQNIEDAAKGMAGNWKKFHSFGWHDEPNDADGWTIIYTENRDSGLLEQSNAATIKKKLDRFDENEVQSEHHGHFAVGWVDGFAIRVFGKNGKITPAFKALWDIGQRMERYPVLDEEDYSRRELDAVGGQILETRPFGDLRCFRSPGCDQPGDGQVPEPVQRVIR